MLKTAVIILLFSVSSQEVCMPLKEFWEKYSKVLKAKTIDDLYNRGYNVKISNIYPNDYKTEYERIGIDDVYTVKHVKVITTEPKKKNKDSVVSNKSLLAELTKDAENFVEHFSSLRDRTVLKFFDCGTNGEDYLFLYEYQRHSLSRRTSTLTNPEFTGRARFYRRVAEAYRKFEERKIAHNNFSVENILMADDELNNVIIYHLSYCIFHNGDFVKNDHQIRKPLKVETADGSHYYSDMPAYLVFVIVTEYLVDNHKTLFRKYLDFDHLYERSNNPEIVEKYCKEYEKLPDGIKKYFCGKLLLIESAGVTFDEILKDYNKWAKNEPQKALLAN